MEYTHVGRSGLLVSRLCLGTMNLGWITSEQDALDILDRAREHGINFIDTANVYGFDNGLGATERAIGRWFDLGDGRREQSVLATKVYASTSDWPNDSKLSAINIRKSCDASLRRLRTDYIDLYQMHHVDLETPWEETWDALSLLVSSGKVLYVGSSNFAGWHLATAQQVAKSKGLSGIVSEQPIYNLLSRWVEMEVGPACEHYGIGLMPWSPLHGGVLGGLRQKTGGTGRRNDKRTITELGRHRDQLEEFESLCNHLGENPAAVALAWLLTRRGVTAPVIGPRTIEQLDDAIKALEIHLDADTVTTLDGIFPGYRPTPEHYAW